MEVKTEKILTIKLTGDEREDFKTAVKKIVEADKEVGFNKKLLSDNEMKLFKEINSTF